MDPLKNSLIFERFLNPARVTMPDFDLDFPDDQRHHLIQYTIDKYGTDQVAQIVTFGRMKARAAIRDVGRAQEVPLHEVDRVAKMIPAIPGKPVTIQDVLTEGHEFYNPELVELYGRDDWVRELLDYSMQLEGVARHSGIHAAAVIVADREITHYAPIMRSTKGGITNAIAQFEFPILESIGLLKVDFLGLSTLSVMREAGRLIGERHDITYNLSNIPFEGEETVEAFKLLSSGEVSGVFQVESAGMRRVLTEMRPTLFEHIIATISLYRPGPLEYIPNYIRRMHGEEEVEYKHDALKPILEETLGIIIYQEQIIQVLRDLAGYSAGEADLVRRAISKKKASDIEKHKKIFAEGCKKRDIAEKAALAIYGDIEFFARYGFNKAHAADYAVITVQTAFLKAHYPVEYMAALLLIERDKTEKVVNFINECRRMGIDVLPPDVNYSGLDFEIQTRPDETESLAQRDPKIGYNFPVPEGSAIRYGMAAVKNVGEGPVQFILDARAEGGPFTGLEDFCDRTDLRKVGKRSLECLIKVGALDRFGKRSQLLDVMDQMVSRSASTHAAKETGQLSMFDLLGAEDAMAASPIKLPNIDEAKGRERLQWEKELLGVYVVSHPLQQLNVDLDGIVTCASNELDETYDGKHVTMAGMISRMRTITTKKGELMAFVDLEDLKGVCEMVVFPRTYADYKEKIEVDAVVLVKGQAQTREGQTNLLVDSIQSYVDQARPVDEPNEVQKPLINAAPTINGTVAGTVNGSSRALDETDETTIYVNDDIIDAGDFMLSLEESPFSGEIPPWEQSVETAPAATSHQNGAVENGVIENGVVKNGVVKNKMAQNSAEPTAGAETETPQEEVREDADPVPRETQPKVEKVAKYVEEVIEESEQRAEKPIQPASTASAQSSNGNGIYKAEDDNASANGSQATTKNGIPTNGTVRGAANGNGHKSVGGQSLYITLRPSGNLERDKFRLKEIYEQVNNPRGKDSFYIVLEANGDRRTLSFPNDACNISKRLTSELEKHFRVEFLVEE